MKILDCENDKTMFESIKQITGIPKNELIIMFDKFNLDEFYETNTRFSQTADSLFLNKIKEMSNISQFHYNQTNWFHLSRTTKSNNFKEGILSLGDNLENIWDLLFTLQEGFLSKDEWSVFRKSLESEYTSNSALLYRMKTSDKKLWGPYAMLIREVTFHSKEIGNHDYLKAPEIIEDICFPFQEKYGFDLLTKFQEVTSSCIVKFETTDVEEWYIGVVINFLYHKHHNLELNLDCNACFDNGGKSIPNESLLQIEYL